LRHAHGGIRFAIPPTGSVPVPRPCRLLLTAPWRGGRNRPLRVRVGGWAGRHPRTLAYVAPLRPLPKTAFAVLTRPPGAGSPGGEVVLGSGGRRGAWPVGAQHGRAVGGAGQGGD